MNRIERTFHGAPTLTREQIQTAKDRLRWYERRDEERARTDKAKNDFESVIYAMREWLTEYSDEHMPYIGSSDKQEELLNILSVAEEWLLEGEGEYATFVEYNSKHAELDGQFQKLKMRKDEHAKRPVALSQARRRLSELEDLTHDLAEKKPWINETHRQDVLDRISDMRKWLSEMSSKQQGVSLSEDPAFRTSEIDSKLARTNAVYTRVSSLPKPREKKAPKRPRNSNIKMENITIDGMDGSDYNWEDFVKMDNGGGDSDQEQ